MKLAVVDDIVLWQTNPATQQTLTASTTQWLTGGVGNGILATGSGQWFDLNLPDGTDYVMIQFESEVVNRGGWTGTTAGTADMRCLGFGWMGALPLFPQGVPNQRLIAPGSAVKAKLIGMSLVAIPMETDIAYAATYDSTGTAKVASNSVVFGSLAPTNGDTIVSRFILGQRAVTKVFLQTDVTPAGDFPAASVSGLSHIAFAVPIVLGVWLPTPATDVLLDARLIARLLVRT